MPSHHVDTPAGNGPHQSFVPQHPDGFLHGSVRNPVGLHESANRWDRAAWCKLTAPDLLSEYVRKLHVHRDIRVMVDHT